MPTASTRTRLSPAPTAGTGSSATRRSPAPWRRTTAAAVTIGSGLDHLAQPVHDVVAAAAEVVVQARVVRVALVVGIGRVRAGA